MSFNDFLQTYKDTHTHPMNKLTHSIGIPMIVFSIFLFLYVALFNNWLYVEWAVGLFILGWVLQFIGHAFEGKPPAFFKNPIHLLVGPVWWVLKILGIKKDQ
ncbi:MAG: DUF962 domain-containing protein [Deltaproteobacteria bacterium]|nr:DUF962 domain-containing protein [Deltaproteobacteria bacterium]